MSNFTTWHLTHEIFSHTIFKNFSCVFTILVKFDQPCTQASSRYPSYQRRLGTKCNSARHLRRIFPTSLIGEVTYKITEDDWDETEIWHLFSWAPKRYSLWCLLIIISIALEKCKKNVILFKLFWHKVFVHWKHY